MRIGIIDIGTNSVRLFIPDENNLVNSRKFMRITRIGEKVNQNRYLLDLAMDRTVQGLNELKSIAEELGVERLVALATSAVRDAENKNDFVERVYNELGIEVEIITGEEEAYLGFSGTIKGLADPNGNHLIIDIGGGSTELIDSTADEIRKSHSFDIGVVRLTEMYELSDPPKLDELERMKSYAVDVVESFLSGCEGDLVGIGGTITTLSAIVNQLQVYDRKTVHGSEISKEEILGIYKRLIVMDNAQRKEVIGLDELRADVIIAGIVILLAIMDLTGKDKIIVSDYDNLEGCFFEKILLTK
jgi:exopolyphosphatase/guanosine-5'-triphosphate,3'-diphosphate pyrophosphatase